MIAWLNPAALAGLLAVAVPILIHLLRQPAARRIQFPSLRFVRPSKTIAARMRRLTDLPLLAVRILIVAFAALALAQPVLLTPARVDAWNARVARAIVLDTSPALARAGAAEAARADAASEQASAFASAVIESADLAAAIRRARDWVVAAPPARREIVIISDFRHGAWSPAAIGGVDDSIGIRLLQARGAAGDHQFTAPALGGGEVEVRLRAGATDATFQSSSSAKGVVDADGLSGADAVLDVLAAAGTPSGDPDEPIALSFGGRGVPDGLVPLPAGWMLAAATRMTTDESLRRAARSARADGYEDAEPWYPVARDTGGRVLVRAASAGGALRIDVAGDADSWLAAAAARSALIARAGRAAPVAEEIVRATPDELARAERAAAPVGADAVRHADRSDARWLWLLVLALMAVETWLRRSRATGAPEVAARAA